MDAPIIDLNLLSSPYDMELARETVRATIPIIGQSTVIPTEGIPVGPAGLDDDSITVSISQGSNIDDA
jgi:hypothetical protein